MLQDGLLWMRILNANSMRTLDTALPKRFAHVIELCWGLEAHPHPDTQLCARGLEPRNSGHKGMSDSQHTQRSRLNRQTPRCLRSADVVSKTRHYLSFCWVSSSSGMSSFPVFVWQSLKPHKLLCVLQDTIGIRDERFPCG